MIDSLALSRLLQLASPMLPVGAYSYSQGLEWAIEEGVVHDAATAEEWIGDVLQHSLCSFELPLLWRICQAWQTQQYEQLCHWQEVFCAGRETSESYAETLQMGHSLRRLLESLVDAETPAMVHLKCMESVPFPTAYGCAITLWSIPVKAALQAYAWSWIENQVSAAIKTIPLGQTDGQRILFALARHLPEQVSEACTRGDDELSNFAPALAVAGCRHETQYSRLFRS